jgi:sortase A
MAKRNKILLFTSVILILVGIFIMLVSSREFPCLNDYNGVTISDYTQNKKLLTSKNKGKNSNGNNKKNNSSSDNTSDSDSPNNSNYTKASKDLYKAMKKYNQELCSKQSTTLTSEKVLTYSCVDLSKYGVTNDCIGYIEIPNINLELPIYLGASDKNMANGTAHLNGTSAPIGGNNTNSVICGHTGYVGRTFFDNLSTLKFGDKIYIHNYWDTLSYKVTETKTVLKNESSILYIQQGKDIITLFTCISDGKGGFNRYVVVAERI